MKFRFGLQAEIVTNITLLVLAVIFLITLVILKLTEWVIIEEKLKSADLLVHLLQNVIENELGEQDDLFMSDLGSDAYTLKKLRDYAETSDLMMRLQQENALTNLFLLNAHFQIALHSDASKIGSRWKDQDIMDAFYMEKVLKTYRHRHFLWIFLRHLEEIHVSSPLSLNDQIIGVIRFSIPLNRVQQSIQKTQLFIFLYLCLDALILIIFGSFLLLRIVVRPLAELLSVTEKVAQEDFSHRLHIVSNNEIGQLTSAFNKMMETIQQKNVALRLQLDHLEAINRELEEAQALAIHVEKMATIGQLAAGVAHEVGNPLGAIFGYLDLLKAEIEHPEEQADLIERIEKETERIHRIVRDLLNYSRPSTQTPLYEDVNEIIQDTIGFLKGQKKLRSLNIVMNLDDHLPQVLIDHQKFRQVLINLILNASDAMSEKGTLTLSTQKDAWKIAYDESDHHSFLQRKHRWPKEPKMLKNRIVRGFSQNLKPGEPLVTLSIQDTGEGISPEHLDRIFEPFFTTKQPGKGTGLGLAIVLQIIESFSGRLAVESVPEQGTTVIIYLPAKQVTP